MRRRVVRGLAVAIAAWSLGCGLSVVGGNAPDVGGDAGGSDGQKPPTDTADLRDVGPLDGSADAALDAADAAPPADADAGPTPSVGKTDRAEESLDEDHVEPEDGAIATDDEDDGAFDVRVTGPVTALALIRTNAAGTPIESEQWDTWVGSDAIPAAVGTVFEKGEKTYQLGVWEDGEAINDASGRVSIAAGEHSLLLFASDVGSFSDGNCFRVVAQTPQGGVVFGPVVTY